MPKYNFMVSRAVDLVARKLAGMDTDTVARLTQVLSEEAQAISEELQYSGQTVDSEILAAKLEGLVARMKYEVRNKGPDPSPHEFPIFNVSHNPSSPYPNPINHLYDKRYKEAYSTFIKQNQAQAAASSSSAPPTSQSAKPSVPSIAAPPSSSAPTAKTSSASSHSSQSQGHYQRQSSSQQPPAPGFIPAFTSQQPNGWPYTSPYVVTSSPQGDQYSQHGSTVMQSPSNSGHSLHRSSTADDPQSSSVSRSASTNDFAHSPKPSKEQIRVRVINDNSAGSRSILRSSSNANLIADPLGASRIYASPSTELNKETMEDIFKVVNSQRADAGGPGASSMPERIIIIDRRGATGGPDVGSNSSGPSRVRTYEIRTPAGEKPAPSGNAITTSAMTPTTPTAAGVYAAPQQTYYPGQQLFYQQPKAYASAANNVYSTASPYVPRMNGFYPFGYYQY